MVTCMLLLYSQVDLVDILYILKCIMHGHLGKAIFNVEVVINTGSTVVR